MCAAGGWRACSWQVGTRSAPQQRGLSHTALRLAPLGCCWLPRTPLQCLHPCLALLPAALPTLLLPLLPHLRCQTGPPSPHQRWSWLPATQPEICTAWCCGTTSASHQRHSPWASGEALRPCLPAWLPPAAAFGAPTGSDPASLPASLPALLMLKLVRLGALAPLLVIPHHASRTPGLASAGSSTRSSSSTACSTVRTTQPRCGVIPAFLFVCFGCWHCLVAGLV